MLLTWISNGAMEKKRRIWFDPYKKSEERRLKVSHGLDQVMSVWTPFPYRPQISFDLRAGMAHSPVG